LCPSLHEMFPWFLLILLKRWLDGITDSGHEFEQAPEDGEGQGSLACCSPWGHKESDMTE